MDQWQGKWTSSSFTICS